MNMFYYTLKFKLGLIDIKEFTIRKSYKLFKKHKLLFIHIPKAAGISFYQSLYNANSYGHFRIADYINIFGQKAIDDLYSFCIVRDPYERLYSGYTYLRKGGRGAPIDLNYQKLLKPYANFDDFVLKFFVDNTYKNVEHFLPQTHWITDEEGNITVDYIGYFEKIQHEYDYLRKKVNSNNDLSFKNRTPQKKEVHFSSEVIEVINQIYHDDFEKLNYKKRNS